MSRKRFWSALVALTAFFTVAAAAVALASSVDTAVVDTTAPTGAVSLEAAQSASIQFNFTVTGNQAGTATFDVFRDWNLAVGSSTFTGSNPQTFTVSPRAASDPATTFTTTGNVSIAPGHATGTFTLSAQAFNITNSNSTGAKLGAGTSSNYSVTVVVPTDSTPPVITPNVSGTLGNNNWYTSDVTVSWSVTDAQSTVTSTTGCGSTTISSDTSGTTLTCSATSAGGTSSQSVSIKRDATAPSFTATPSAAANTNGFNNSPVDVSYSCSDATSGLADACPGTDSATTDGIYVFSHTIHDNAGNAASVSTNVNLDSTKPSISGSALPAANGYGWNNEDVTVTFFCSDTGTGASGIDSCVADGSSPAADHVVVSSEGANQSIGGTATDNAGNSNSASVSVSIDKTAPEISFGSKTAANGNGWNSSEVTVLWSCSDPGGSGVVDASVSQTLTANGADQSATGTCEDKAGNTASDTVSGINIDKTAPTITFNGLAPDENGNGWRNTDVTGTWNCDDSVSGVIQNAVTDSTTSEGSNLSVTGTCEDLAGNTASDTKSGIKVDKTAPTASASASPAPNGQGWNNSNVTVSFSGSDSLSGIDFCDSAVVLNTEGAGQSASGTCTDKAGNVSGPATAGSINIDKTAPSVSLVGGPANGASYYFGSVPAAPTCTANDALSGVSAAGCAVSGYDTSVGSHTVTASAADDAGNTASASSTYTVLAWTFSGFYQPVDMSILNTVKAGSTVPIKFELFAGSTELIDTNSVVQPLKASQVNCDGSLPTDAIELTATGGTQLRYDSAAGQFVYNWQTPKTAGLCYSVTIKSIDGSSKTALFKLK